MSTVEASNSILQTIDIGLRSLLYTKFHDILVLESINKGVILYPKSIALREMAEKRGQVEVEMISLWRTMVAPDWKRMQTPAARRGINLEYVSSSQEASVNVKSIPVRLEYDVWFWTHYLERLNQIAERYLFWQQDNPNLSLNYTLIHNKGTENESSEDYPVEFDLHFGTLVDESTVEEKYDRGQIFILKTPIILDGWAFSSEAIGTIQKIVLVLYDKDNLTDAEIDNIVVEEDDSSFDSETEEALRLYEEHIYSIVVVNVDEKQFSVAKDNASEFVAGNKIYIKNSTGNDGIYTIVSASDDDTYTNIVVLEEIEDATADGSICLKNYSE
ncbi:MAG: hypothetical protein ACTSU7_15125 [Candidatus Heimdallarchaeaceae archaeon]